MSVKEYYCHEIYFPEINQIIFDMKDKFNSKLQEILVAMQQVVWGPVEDEASIQLISKFYGLDADLIKAERNIIRNMEFPNDPTPSNFSDLLSWFGKLVKIFLPYRVLPG